MKPGPKPKVQVKADFEQPSDHVPRGQLGFDGAKDLWRRLAPALIEVGLLSIADVPAFLMACRHYAIAAEAERIVSREGLETEDNHGLPRKHPLLQVLRDNSRAFRLYASEFGLMPSSRQRMDFDAPEDADELARLLFRHATVGREDNE